jgi:hypothetical protein
MSVHTVAVSAICGTHFGRDEAAGFNGQATRVGGGGKSTGASLCLWELFEADVAPSPEVAGHPAAVTAVDL